MVLSLIVLAPSADAGLRNIYDQDYPCRLAGLVTMIGVYTKRNGEIPEEKVSVRCDFPGQIVTGHLSDHDNIVMVLKIFNPDVPQPTFASTSVVEGFVVGSPGNFDQEPFGPILMNAPGGAFSAPMLTSSVDLFVGIDLNEWIPQSLSFVDGDLFDIVGGVSPELPGFIIGTSEVMFTSAAGFTTTDPYTGSAVASGALAGSLIDHIPEPKTSVLFLSGLILLLSVHRFLRSSADGRHGAAAGVPS